MRRSLVVLACSLALLSGCAAPSLGTKAAVRPAPPAGGPAGAIAARASAEVVAPGRVFHVTARTESRYVPPPDASAIEKRMKDAAKDRNKQHGFFLAGEPQWKEPPRVAVTEHWYEPTHPWLRSHWAASSAATATAQAMNATVLERDGVHTELVTQSEGQPKYTWTDANIRALQDRVDDQAWFGNPGDPSDPRVYHDLLATSTLIPPLVDVNGRRLPTKTRTWLLPDGSIEGTPTYRILVRMTNGAGDAYETSLVAEVRKTDFLPLRVEGRTWIRDTRSSRRDNEQSFVTTFTVAESLPASQVPARTWQLPIPRNARVHSSLPASPADLPKLGFDVWWLGKGFEGLKLARDPKVVNSSDEYPSWRDPDSTVMRAIELRPWLAQRFVVAEYSPNGILGSATEGRAVSIKAYSMPRTDESTWEKTFRDKKAYTFGQTFDLGWTTVAGRKALRLVRAGTSVRIEWLAFSTGNGTVMLQGTDTEPGQLDRAATALLAVR